MGEWPTFLFVSERDWTILIHLKMLRNDVFSMFSILAPSSGYVTGKCLENMQGLLGVYLFFLVSFLYVFKNNWIAQ